MICMARIFGAPLTVPAGKVAAGHSQLSLAGTGIACSSFDHHRMTLGNTG
jgi:hypothetical protein